ncbi:MAG: HDOD domain-containing protein [Oscillospiraceae bacterium]|nr:HDOD domain-containing protein [Oscillospiraceae bacterium]
MANKYIVRQAIKDAKGEILGYEILYHGENQAFGSDAGAANDFAAADTIYSFLTQNSTRGLKGSLNFMTFTTMLLMKKTPKLFDKSELVIQIDDSVIIHPLSMHFVHQYAKEGYKIAVNEFQFAPRYLTLLDSIDYIKLNIQTSADLAMHNTIDIAHSMNKKCIVTNIRTEEEYNRAVTLGADALEGPYVADRLTTKAHSGAYLQSNFFRLMVAVTKDEPDVDEIERLISMDAGLTYGLLKIANSVYFALRHRATTIHQAIMTLGLGQLKQWIYLLSASNANGEQVDSGTEEFLKLSFMRANFCSELMKYAADMPISKSEAYLMGMFSTLNHLIEAPLEEILNEVPVAEEIKSALLRKEGRCGKLYELVLSYEAADWNAISSLAEELEIPNQVLTNVYFVCMENVNVLWEQLNHSYVEAEPDPNSSAQQEKKPGI